jgi:hypothetical protein
MKYALVRETQDPHECKLVSLHNSKEEAESALEKTCQYIADKDNCARRVLFDQGMPVGKRSIAEDFHQFFFIAGP